MGRYRVDLDRLADIVDTISHFDARVETALEDLDGRVNRLHVTWTGQAAAEHRRVYEEWKRAVDDMRMGAAVMRANAATAHANYSSAAAVNAVMWEQAL